MPKPKIAKNVPGEKVRLMVPREFQSVIDSRLLPRESYTVIAFSGMRGESTSIVDSGAIVRALEKADSSASAIVAVAHNFTVEARDLLEKCGALRFNTSDFYWTDEALANTRSGPIK